MGFQFITGVPESSFTSSWAALVLCYCPEELCSSLSRPFPTASPFTHFLHWLCCFLTLRWAYLIHGNGRRRQGFLHGVVLCHFDVLTLCLTVPISFSKQRQIQGITLCMRIWGRAPGSSRLSSWGGNPAWCWGGWGWSMRVGRGRVAGGGQPSLLQNIAEGTEESCARGGPENSWICVESPCWICSTGSTKSVLWVANGCILYVNYWKR